MIISVILVAGIAFALSSCGIDDRIALDETLHDTIIADDENNPAAYIMYQDRKYTFAGSSTFLRVACQDDILIGWNGMRWLGYIDKYYSYTDDSPSFIYEKRNSLVYFPENYDYHSDTFLIENTNEEILFSDICQSESKQFAFYNPIEITLYSKTNPKIKVIAELVSLDKHWYISFAGQFTVWCPSDSFMEIMSKNNYI